MIGRLYRVITARLHNADDGSVVLDIWEGEDGHPDESMGRVRLKAQRLVVQDSRTFQGEINWASVARRMDDANNAGEPLWNRLTDDEIRALCHDEVRMIPAEVEHRRGRVHGWDLPEGDPEREPKQQSA